MSAGDLASIKINHLKSKSTNASVTKKQILSLRSSVDRGGDVPPLGRQRIWRSGSCSPRHGLTRRLEPDSCPFPSGLNAHRGCGVCTAGSNRGFSRSPEHARTACREGGSESGIQVGGEHAQGCRTSKGQGSCPKMMQKRDDMAPRTRSANILRPPYLRQSSAPEAAAANAC